MKRFELYLATNLILLLILIYVVTTLRRRPLEQSKGPNPTSGVVAQHLSGVSHGSQPAPGWSPEPEGKFFWRQLELGGCRSYIRNLRQIGCPEQTIHDIVRGDVERLYAARRVELHLDGSGTGPWSIEEERRLVAHLLGEPDTLPATESEQTRAESAPEIELNISKPLVFGPVDPVALNLDEGQQEALEELRQQFVDEIGGLGQDPNDPAYADRWQAARARMDALVPGTLGREVFLRMQTELVAEDPE